MSIQKAGATLDLDNTEKQYGDRHNNNAPLAYLTVNSADGRILNCNKTAQKLLNYSKKELLQIKAVDLYANTPDGLPKAQKIFKDFQTGKTIRNVELQVKQRKGGFIWVNLSVEPESDQSGKTIRSRSMIAGISVRKQTEIAQQKAPCNVQKLVKNRTAVMEEKSLINSERSFRALAENANDGIILIKMNGHIVYANKCFAKISGLNDRGPLKPNINNLIEPSESDRIWEILRGIFEENPVLDRFEYNLINKSGRAVPVEATASRTIWQGEPVAMMVVRDITSQRQMEAELLREQLKLEILVKERTKELVESNNALSVLARNIDRKREEFLKHTSWVVTSKILPIIETFQESKAFTNHRAEFDMLKAYLKELTAELEFGPGVIFILSNAELRIATMIRNGFSSPEISRLLNVSLETVKTHRKNIRKKLNICNTKINLTTYLQTKLG